MNNYIFRRLTSSIFASLFIFSFGVGSVKPVNSQETKRLQFCKNNPSLFHLNEGKEKKVKVAVLDFESNGIKTKSQNRLFVTNISGLGSVLESKLVHENGADENKFAVIKWNSINTEEKGNKDTLLGEQRDFVKTSAIVK
ncbi:MAG: hypothetical protein MJK14_10195, partial [Rivularia sp. ALOHA_DT_140]|nr:hypothetical protein [Rivularia sp. ALOHA_DT_140]